jgi:heme exporter protein D
VNWGGWQAFWAMGGYGGYVWGAYGTVAALVLVETLGVRSRLARARRAVMKKRRRS